MGRSVRSAFVVLIAAAVFGCSGQKQAKLLVALPDFCNTPDGMCLLSDNSIILSVPNFNDESSPPLLMRITPDNKAEVFYRFPTPYPGLAAPADRIRPMGIARGPGGDLFLADMQFMQDKNQKSRLWRLSMRSGKVEKMSLVASGFNVANGIAIHNGHIYITESVLEDTHPLVSAVMRFRLDEENVVLKTPLKEDPHVIATFHSTREDWRFGADGIAFDSRGNLFVGLFGEGEIWKCEFDKDGVVKSNRLFAKALGKMINCDGMTCDPRTDKLYVADSAANAIQVISRDGTVTTLAQNGDVVNKLTGELDQPCEAMLRGDTVVVSNMDWPFPNFVNKKWQQPATISVIRLTDWLTMR